ncbi:hypothetical protein MSG28_008284 [Choristoneura fumiferana]|uniref:Uncharacterized protein n=1 Tax=Choristoneura fumiferana TaxID=7141 RepID=A0ACC0JAR3_CHOFU|nr:hypothetical protein MSG28_008284 [Choristoneura fumiferana]
MNFGGMHKPAKQFNGFGLYNVLYTILTGMVIISYVTVAFSSTILVPASACDLETTSAQQGAMVAAPVVGNVLGTLIWGYLADTRGRRRMLLVSLCLAATINGLASISVHWAMLMIMQFFATFMASGQYALSMTLLSESVPRAQRNIVVLLVSSIFLLSQGIMSVLAIPILPLSFSNYLSSLDIYWNSWRTLLVVYCLPSLISAVCLFYMQESPKFVLAKGDEEAALKILKIINRVNNGKSKEFEVKGILLESSTEVEKAAVKDQILPLFKFPLLKPTLIISSLFILFQMAASFMVWLPTISNQFIQTVQTGEGSDMTLCGIIASSLDAPPDPDAVPCAIDVTALLMVLGVCGLQSITNGLLSVVVEFGGRRNTAIGVTAFCGVCGILVNLVPNAIGSAILFAGFLLSIIVIGMYTAMCVALFPTHLRAMAVALVLSAGRIASFVFIQLTNFLLETNCELGFYLFASFYTASALILMLLPDDRVLLKPQITEKEENGSARL